jgi:hypothetical protein
MEKERLGEKVPRSPVYIYIFSSKAYFPKLLLGEYGTI